MTDPSLKASQCNNYISVAIGVDIYLWTKQRSITGVFPTLLYSIVSQNGESNSLSYMALLFTIHRVLPSTGVTQVLIWNCLIIGTVPLHYRFKCSSAMQYIWLSYCNKISYLHRLKCHLVVTYM